VSIHPPLARVAVAVRPYLSWISGVALVLLAGIGVSIPGTRNRMDSEWYLPD
jgi:hypothetical protein